MEILDSIDAVDLFLYLKKYHTFIISDIHIGYEESLNRHGILIPRNNYSDLLLRLEKVLEKLSDLKSIIINGDIIHEFGKVSRDEKDLVKKLLKFLTVYAPVTIIEGNHDKALRYIVGENTEIIDKKILENILVIHGDKIPSKASLKNIKTIIIGHEHPAITISSGSRGEKFKCFLK